MLVHFWWHLCFPQSAFQTALHETGPQRQLIKQLIETNEIKLNELIGFNNKVTFETLNHALLMLKKSNLILANDTLNLKNINNSRTFPE